VQKKKEKRKSKKLFQSYTPCLNNQSVKNNKLANILNRKEEKTTSIFKHYCMVWY